MTQQQGALFGREARRRAAERRAATDGSGERRGGGDGYAVGEGGSERVGLSTWCGSSPAQTNNLSCSRPSKVLSPFRSGQSCLSL
jgi:hypothetical protein